MAKVGVTDVFQCSCPNGWVGQFCETSNECDPNPCQHDGVCVFENGVRSCVCNDDHFGNDCEENFLSKRLEGLEGRVDYMNRIVSSSSALFLTTVLFLAVSALLVLV